MLLKGDTHLFRGYLADPENCLNKQRHCEIDLKDCVCTHACVCVCTRAHVHGCMWRLEDNLEYHIHECCSIPMKQGLSFNLKPIN